MQKENILQHFGLVCSSNALVNTVRNLIRCRVIMVEHGFVKSTINGRFWLSSLMDCPMMGVGVEEELEPGFPTLNDG